MIFAYQGVVPKLIARHVDEIAMLGDAGVPGDATGVALNALGISELALAAALLLAWRKPWPALLCLVLMPLVTAAVWLRSPQFFEAAFNPLTLNVAVASLAAIDLLVLASVPSAARCLRSPSPEKE